MQKDMKTMRSRTISQAAMAGLAFLLIAAAPATHPQFAVTDRIPAADGGWDYAAFDATGNRVYIARSDAITAVDITTGVASQLAHANGAHAVVPIPGTKLLAETDAGTASVRLVDRQSGAEMAKIAVGEKPDAAIYDPLTHMLLVMNAKSGTVSIVDPARAAVTATITLKPGLEFAAIDGKHRLFVNNEDENEMEVVDLDSRKVLPAVALPGCTEPSGLAYSTTAIRLIAACSNNVAAVVDPMRLEMTASVPIGAGPDAVILDDARGLAFIPAGETGELDILRLDRSGTVSFAGHVATASGARTGTLDPATGRIFLPNGEFEPLKPGEKHRSLIPGSFSLMVIKPS